MYTSDSINVHILQPADTTMWYVIHGVAIAVVADHAEVRSCVDATYAAFRHAPLHIPAALTVQLQSDAPGAVFVRDSNGYERQWNDVHAALLDLLNLIVHSVLARLYAQGIYAIHAGAVVYRGAALVIAGRSGQGKTTLVLGLLQRGLGLLSDEFAIVEPGGARIAPYRRSLHIRPATLDLIPALSFLRDQPQLHLGGGIEWSLTPSELAQMLPARLADAAPLRYVLLLDGLPQPTRSPRVRVLSAALTTMELLRGTWAASVQFDTGLARMSRLLDGVACARLQVGALDTTLDCVLKWLESLDG